MSKVGRNSPCPCGSGKKYKQCHLGKERELEPTSESGGANADGDGGPTMRVADPVTPTWKLFVAGALVLALVGGVLYYIGQERIAGVVGGVGGVLLVIWSAFRTPPPPRNDQGSAEAINFGN